MTFVPSAYETQRLKALVDLDILDTPEEHEYDELVKLASEICDTPISLVSLVDRERQWFKAVLGLDVRQTPRNVSFCSHAIQKPDLFVIENATTDERFRNNGLVTGAPGIRFYAGIPLHSPSGFAVGTLCVIDTVPRKLTENQKDALIILGRQVKARLELRVKHRALEQAAIANERLTADLRDKNNLFQTFMNNSPFLSYIKDQDGRMVFYNDRMAQRFGVSSEEWNGLTDAEIWPPRMAEAFRRNDVEVLKHGLPVEIEELSPGPNGAATHWKSFKFPLHLENGERMLAGISVDQTESLRRQAELEKTLTEKLELAKSLESTTILFETFVKNNPNICCFKSDAGRYLAYNDKFAELYGIGAEEWVGKSDHDVMPQEMADSIHAIDQSILQQDRVSETSEPTRNAAGERVWHKWIKFPIRTSDGRTILANVAIDLTREVEKEQALSEANAQLERLATTDPLTGLSNRRVFESCMQMQFASVVRNGRMLAVVTMDVDNFKKRNDTYGHAAGDDALRTLGCVLLDSIRNGDVAARMGGEEFAVLLPGTSVAGAIEFARRIQLKLSLAESGMEPLTLSMGIAAADIATGNWERLLSHADDAMYKAKRAGKDCFQVHEPSAEAIESATFSL